MNFLLDTGQLLGRRASDVNDIPPMYQEIFQSGYRTVEGTVIQCCIFVNSIPSSMDQLYQDLITSLGEKSDSKPN